MSDAPIHCGDEPLVFPSVTTEQPFWTEETFFGGWLLITNLPSGLTAQCPACGREWELREADTQLCNSGYTLEGFNPATLEAAERVIGKGYSQGAGPGICLLDAADRLLVTKASARSILGESEVFCDTHGRGEFEGYHLERVAAVVGSEEHLKAVRRRASMEPHVRGAVEAVLDGKLSVEELRDYWLDIISDKVPEMLVIALAAL